MTFKLYMEGDKSKAYCPTCACLVSTTFVRRDVPFSDGHGLAKDIMVASCDRCDMTVATPPQSTPAIRAAREKITPVEARLPAFYVDILDLVAYQVNTNASTEFRKPMLTWALHQYASGDRELDELHHHYVAVKAVELEKKTPTRRRLSFKLNSQSARELEVVVRDVKMTQTNVFKSLIYGLKQDVLVAKNPAVIRELRTLPVVT